MEKAIFQEELKNLVNDIKEENKKLSEVKNDDKNYEMKGVYGPGDKMWEVGRESALFLGGFYFYLFYFILFYFIYLNLLDFILFILKFFFFIMKLYFTLFILILIFSFILIS